LGWNLRKSKLVDEDAVLVWDNAIGTRFAERSIGGTCCLIQIRRVLILKKG
jgi:hypothetical protein